ncbi:MAG: metalloprotease PmbA [Halofilum sp. (in: g-proteobacteria)]
MSRSDAEQQSGADLPSRAEMEDLIGHALERAADEGADSAEAEASVADGLSVAVRLGEVETLEYQRDRSLAVTVFIGQHTGSASTGDFRPEAVADAVAAACRIARYTAADPYTGLADSARMARELPDLDLYHPWGLTAEDAIERARACETAARADQRITNSEGADVGSHQVVSAYGNSHDFRVSECGTRHSISCAVIGGRGDGMQRDYWYTVARAPDDLESPESVGRHAAERTLARMDATQVATTECPVLFAPEMARSLLGHLVGAVRGSALYRDASFLVGSLGEQLFPEFVRIHEQPHLPRALGSTPCDREGVATAPRDLVSEGVLRGYVLDSYSARRLGMETTGNAGGVHNLTLEPGEASFDELVRRMDRGLIVTEMMGQGVNTVTGDYSRGAAGFWVENGAITQPVQEVTIAGHLRRMFAGIVAVGNDVDTRAGIRSPSILIDRMTLAGN